MMQLKACPRCGGDVTVEEMYGETEFVCLQCGHRKYAVYRLERPASRRIQRMPHPQAA
jgi:DNA-directed RNA polymerase subunit RPC12/RpoP